jgi:type IV pilus assembly protein PilV
MIVRAQAGVGLIEVLIALLVLSIGMLGMAGLQMWSLKSNQGAMERGMAVMQTHTIVDAMRAARTTAIKRGFDIEFDQAVGDLKDRTAFAIASLTAWRTTLANNLGEGATGRIHCDGASCDISIRWQDRTAQATGDEAEEESGPTQVLTTQVRL